MSKGIVPPRERSADASSAPPLDLDALEKRLRGDFHKTVCNHYDVASDPPDSPYRRCVLDEGRPHDCEMSSQTSRAPVTARDACPFWQTVAFVKPEPLTIEEGLALIEAARAEGTRVAAQPLTRSGRPTQ